MSINQIKKSKFFNEEYNNYNATSEEAKKELAKSGYRIADKFEDNTEELDFDVIVEFQRSLHSKDARIPIFGKIISTNSQKIAGLKNMEAQETIKALKLYKSKFGNISMNEIIKKYKDGSITSEDFMSFYKISQKLPIFGKEWFEY
jgi:hypothetical protein